MLKVVTRLLPLLLLVLLFRPGGAAAQQPDHPPNLNLGDAVVTGFSGTLAPDDASPHPANKSPVDLTFINPDGPSARIVNIGRPGYAWDGRLLAAPKRFDVLAKDVGQVFGVALDEQNPPNIYVAATSVFGLNIVGRGHGGLPERRKKGGPGAGWMKGQFGLDLQGGPGGIYKIDGRTGVVTLFANVTLDGVPNPGPALGNLAYDSAHKQLFVSDVYTGMIHRFDLDGNERGRYDHGVAGLGAAKVTTIPFDPNNRPNIASEHFDSEKPDSWGLAPDARRVLALAVNEDRLYYSVVAGPQIWSVGIEPDGGFASDPRWELDIPAQAGALPVSDIAFSHQGAMIVAQRGLIAGAYDYSAFTQPGEPHVLRFWLKDPNDPPSPGRWKLAPEEYAVGFAGDYRNTNGGAALGYGYADDGTLSATACEAALWTTGQNLRNNPQLRGQLEPGGPLVVHGLQGSPADMVRDANTPPTISYFVDYDDKFHDPRASGHVGSVRIYTTPCAPAAYVRPVASNPAGGAGGGGGGGGACVCQPPLLPGPIAGQCICPQGTVLDGNECVPQTCPTPLVYSPVAGACVCLPGRKCLCPAPLVPGPVEGECIWPPQTKQCVAIDGSFSVTKVVSPDPRHIGSTLPFPLTVTCTPAPPAPPSFTVIINGNTSTVPINVPVGSHCMVIEGTLPPLPPGCHWLPPIYAPAGVTIATGSNQETVTNGYACREVCPPPQVANVDGICTCPPPTVPGAVPGSCVCPEGMELVGGKCVKKIVCDPPKIPNTAGTQCICRDGLVRRGGECVEVKQPKHEQTCKRGFVQSGDMCVRRKTEPKDDKSRDRPDFEIPGGLPGLGGRGGLGGGGGGGMSSGRR